jgi:hypothetical protein
VTSVAVTGLLGFLLVHPLRADPEETWIRTYARWLFIGLIPSAVMLLVALWKRIEPYGLTEPRVLGLLLGAWLLGVAITFTMRPAQGIRRIPTSLAVLFLVTLYGPQSVTGLSVASQRNRMRDNLRTASTSDSAAAQASASLRFLMEHQAERAIEAAVGAEIPTVDWEHERRRGSPRDSLGIRIMALAGVRYLPEYAMPSDDGSFNVFTEQSSPMPVTGFDWMVTLHSGETRTRTAGGDSLAVQFDTATGIALVRIGADTVRFELLPLGARIVDSIPAERAMRSELLTVEPAAGPRRARLLLQNIGGRRSGDTLVIRTWSGTLLIGARPPG